MISIIIFLGVLIFTTGCYSDDYYIQNVITQPNSSSSSNTTGYYNSITNFTGTLTDGKYCTYDGNNNLINCTSEAGSDGTSLWNQSGSNIYYNTGNVGIGTTLPSGKLHIYESSPAVNDGSANPLVVKNGMVGIGTTDPKRALHIAATNFAYMHLTNDETGHTNVDGFSFGLVRSGFGLDPQASMRMRENLPVTIWTNNIERIRITSTGNVGIGTTEPANKLSVLTNLDADGIYLVNSVNSGYASITNGVTATAGAFYPQLRGKPVGDYGFRFRGLQSDTASLSTPTFSLQAANSAGTGAVANNQVAIGLMNWATSLMSILGNGNVGIGTTTPATKLDVDGIIKTAPRSTATCDSDAEGGIYYDSDDNTFYGCNSTSWVALS